MMLKAFVIFPVWRVASFFAGLCLLASAAEAQSQAAAPVEKAGAAPVFSRDISALPDEVQRLREEILRAATSGDIEQLRVPIEMNELPPVFAGQAGKDPVAHLKTLSGDGHGREILAILFELLTTGYAISDPGTEKEMVIWPYHAMLPLDALTPGQEVELYRLISPGQLKDMRSRGRYTWYRVGVGRDGVWHFFDKPE
jgi:hypothetical protein